MTENCPHYPSLSPPTRKKETLAKAISSVTFSDTYCSYKAGEEAKADWPPDYCATK